MAARARVATRHAVSKRPRLRLLYHHRQCNRNCNRDCDGITLKCSRQYHRCEHTFLQLLYGRWCALVYPDKVSICSHVQGKYCKLKLPNSWCDCGPSKRYPTLSPTGGAPSDAKPNCAYTTLPDSTINPVSASGTSAPTNVPGKDGVVACAYYIATYQGYPPGTPNYCFCGGGGPDTLPPALAPLLTHMDVTPAKTDCAYDTQPTAGWKPPTPTSSGGSSSTITEKPTYTVDPYHSDSLSCGATWSYENHGITPGDTITTVVSVPGPLRYLENAC